MTYLSSVSKAERIPDELNIIVSLINPLAHESEYFRRSHGLWPKKATFLALIISDQIFKNWF